MTYRVGYSPQKNYPWRWTTPLALVILLMSTVLLTCVNIPLSGYETVEEFTYFPNASIAALPMQNLIPSFLRPATAKFSPQHLNVGQVFSLNGSAVSYTIQSAFDAGSKESVLSFPYYNNPFSNNCDIQNITVNVNLAVEDLYGHQYYGWSATGFILCNYPTAFEMSWGMSWDSAGGPQNAQIDFAPLNNAGTDLLIKRERNKLSGMAYSRVFGVNSTQVGGASVSVTARPCCSCNGANTSEAVQSDVADLLEFPCTSQPAQFIGISGNVVNSADLEHPWGFPYNWAGSNTSDLFSGLDPQIQYTYFSSKGLSALQAPFHNMLQIVYHFVRSDLGLIFENQIFSSPEMFNSSIRPIDIPSDSQYTNGPFGLISYSMANEMLASTLNTTLMQEWKSSVLAMERSTRVPVLEYLHPISQFKPLGSAMTSVFVATFAMVSAVWTVFGLVARAFVSSPEGEGS
ncbi:hypothetical protein R3P38DRAFT_2791982 [Favolaschia claudopus]|uniref:Uncharacterized protein n=1 Tax=Favolaschia claudopus TaxID=2862362 RepID=A0AAW0AFF1_9AGAR